MSVINQWGIFAGSQGKDKYYYQPSTAHMFKNQNSILVIIMSLFLPKRQSHLNHHFFPDNMLSFAES